MATDIRNLASRVQPGKGPPPRGSPGARDRSSDAVENGRSFQEELQQATTRSRREVKLSGHAQKRLDQRDISLNAAQRRSIDDAVHQLSDKGARDALLLRSDAAFLVNVPNRTVVTAMDQAEMQERVFTDIDSAYLLDQ